MKWIGVYIMYVSLNFALLSPVPIDPKIARSQIVEDMPHDSELNDQPESITPKLFNIYAPEYDFESHEPDVKSIDVDHEIS